MKLAKAVSIGENVKGKTWHETC